MQEHINDDDDKWTLNCIFTDTLSRIFNALPEESNSPQEDAYVWLYPDTLILLLADQSLLLPLNAACLRA